MTDAPDKIVWVDLESTGLNENEDVILEVGMRVTDWYGEEMQRITLPVWNPGWKQLLRRDTEAAQYVKNMHVNSGLVDAIVALDMQPDKSKHCVAAQEIKLIDWFDEHVGIDGPIDGKYAMAGSSVSMDRRFLARYMPTLNDKFHYRIIDVSSIREACRYVNRPLHILIEDSATHALKKQHRPQEDIDDTIVLWQLFFDNFFFVEDED